MSAVKNKHTWLCSALIFSALGLMQPMPHAEDAPRPAIKPNAAATVDPWAWSGGVHEHDHEYACSDFSVMVGLRHKGDEEESTYYRCASVHQFQQLKTSDAEWQKMDDESSHTYNCPTDKVMTGREHVGDENEPTSYQCSTVIDAWGNAMRVVVDSEWTNAGLAHETDFECPANKVIASRKHIGDEEEPTYFKCASLW
ncbi:hypothetical protein AFK24_15230 [Pseudomonas syringae]|uniref:Secreted protein n=1 Tax=Pseudomonas syringae TaxID=317 RepID=A0A1C7Z504_PSESX|nr:hypothetical protein [Pseudomonas syringae]OCR24116.1 hypothetical protein AFK24_15230 [Pseudomonas syringae]